MGISSCRICTFNILSFLTSICVYGINLCIFVWCSNRSRGIIIIKYFITDTSFPLFFTFESIKKHSPSFVCYRNKINPTKKEIINFSNFAKNYSKIFINFDSLIDKSLIKYFDGIHFPSKYIKNLNELKKEFPDKIFITSTHSFDEIKKSQISDYITFSPIFNSKGRNGLGIEMLNKACEIHPNVIALGGIISDKEVEQIKKSKACGFGSIRYFYIT